MLAPFPRRHRPTPLAHLAFELRRARFFVAYSAAALAFALAACGGSARPEPAAPLSPSVDAEPNRVDPPPPTPETTTRPAGTVVATTGDSIDETLALSASQCNELSAMLRRLVVAEQGEKISPTLTGPARTKAELSAQTQADKTAGDFRKTCTSSLAGHEVKRSMVTCMSHAAILSQFRACTQ